MARFYRLDPASSITHRIFLQNNDASPVALLDAATYGTSLNWCDVVSVGSAWERCGAGGDS